MFVFTTFSLKKNVFFILLVQNPTDYPYICIISLMRKINNDDYD